MFGYPTGVGSLLARREALARLRRTRVAGGTITIASVQGDGYYLAEGEAGFEDGTINYLTLPAIEIGLRYIDTIGIDIIHTHVMCLTGWLLEQLTALYHHNGMPLIRVYGPLNTDRRGSTVTVNFYDAHGHLIDFRHIEQAANAVNISLRTGCFYNPGAGEVANGLTREDMEPCFRNEERMTFEHFIEVMDGRASGAVRVSIGLPTTFADVYKFVEFAKGFLG